MEILVSVVGSVVGCACSYIEIPVAELCKHLRNPTKEIEVLRDKRGELIARLEDTKRRLRIADKQGRISSSEVHIWLRNADEFIAKMNELEENATVPKRCLNGVLPDCSSRLNLGRHIAELIKEVNHLLEKVDCFSEESLTFPTIEMGMEMVTTTLMGQAIGRNLEKVWESLMDDEVGVIGAYGMGGVGKTAMMKNINNRLLEQKHYFDKVIWVTVNKDANAHKLQNDIAKVVNLDLSLEQDEAIRSSLLLKELSKYGKTVLMLDDVWEAFALHEIGIPDFDIDKGCKVILTTRSLEVCQMMGCREYIKVDLLSKDEAWDLFVKIFGGNLVPEVENIAKNVAQECSCLPLAIITVAGAMRGKDDIHEWRVALNDLQESTNWVVNMDEQVLERLRFSYNRLGDDISKKCFMYFAMYPEDFEFIGEWLIDLWVMEGVIKGRSIEDELDKGRAVLNKLKRSSLLEYESKYGFGTDVWEYYKMHDLTRDMALYITNANSRIMVNTSLTMEGFPDEDAWDEDLEEAYFIKSDIKEILISPNCPRLTSLLLSYSSLECIAHGFFVQMQSLRILNLSSSQIQLLPESISDLVNLHVLDLSHCSYLKRIPSVEKLRALKMLMLGYTDIAELPQGMEALVHLERLNLAETRSLKEIPVPLISKFCFLQELFVYPIMSSIPFIDELLGLTHLESLCICFNDLSDFIYYVGSKSFEHLNYFCLYVGNPEDEWLPYPIRDRSVSICNYSAVIPDITLLLPQNTDRLEMKEFDDLTGLCDLSCLKDVKGLRRCWIEKCSNMEYILSSEQGEDLVKHLEVLTIWECPKLNDIFKGVAAHGTLSYLKKLNIDGCDNLKYLCSCKLFSQLQNLVEVSICYCDKLEEVISSEEEEGEGVAAVSTILTTEEVRSEGSGTSGNNITIIIPKLKKLVLENLPQLRSIWEGSMVCDALQTIEIEKCIGLKRLPRFCGEVQSPPPTFKKITGSKEWWDSLEWDGSSAKYLFQPLFREKADGSW